MNGLSVFEDNAKEYVYLETFQVFVAALLHFYKDMMHAAIFDNPSPFAHASSSLNSFGTKFLLL